MSNTKQYTISLNIPEGWVPTGEYRKPTLTDAWLSAEGRVIDRVPYDEKRIILKKAFVSKPLEAGKKYFLSGQGVYRYLPSGWWLDETNWHLIRAYDTSTDEGRIEEVV